MLKGRDGAALDLSGLHHIVGFLLAISTLSTRKAFQRHLGRPFQLRPVEFTLLMVLLANQTPSPKQLAQALSLPPPNVTVLVDRLAARGLVERRRNRSDGRAFEVALTAQGADLARRAQRISLTMEDDLLAMLSPGELAILRELLLKLATGAQQSARTAPDAPAEAA